METRRTAPSTPSWKLALLSKNGVASHETMPKKPSRYCGVAGAQSFWLTIRSISACSIITIRLRVQVFAPATPLSGSVCSPAPAGLAVVRIACGYSSVSPRTQENRQIIVPR